MTIKLHGSLGLTILRKTEAGLTRVSGKGEVGLVWGYFRKDHRARLALFLPVHSGDDLLVFTHTLRTAGPLRTHGPRNNNNLPLTCTVQRFWEL